jgi:hypothetical protein
MANKINQTELILRYMQRHGSITQLDALRDLGCMRLASRISDLKRQGYPIESKTEAIKTRYREKTFIKRYSLRTGGELL